MRALRTGSLCTGYGGLDRAVHSVLGGELAWVADIDPGAAAILAHRFPVVPNLGDITATDWSSIEPVDVLTAGFPCQDISCAGRRAGLREGTRSGLWFHVARAIRELRPPLVVIENVKELLSERADSDMEQCPWCMGDAGSESTMRALGAVLASLAQIGFDAEWVSVPAASAGACHLRWRVFILAWPAADPGSPRRRRVAGGAPGDEGQDAGRPAAFHHEPRRGRADAPADPARLGEGEPADQAHTVSGSRRARAVPGSRSDRTAADSERGGRDGRPREPEREPDWRTAAWWHRPGAFGRYEAAVRQHERVFGRLTPAPVAPNKTGEPRLAPAFNEWMMGLPEGWVTDVPGLSRNAQLKALGNGVVPQQAELALRLLLERAALAESRGAA
jgi:DNA (cytosine-5)-methyltransferase 1